jgi:mediator of RNA polymerase II transcription subunit 5
VAAFIHRYELEPHDIGIAQSSFVAQLLSKGHISRQLQELSDEEKKYLNGWITGLFNPDGITDEVMAQCRPQEMYLLAPTIACQAVAACAQGILDISTIKQGLDCK